MNIKQLKFIIRLKHNLNQYIVMLHRKKYKVYWKIKNYLRMIKIEKL